MTVQRINERTKDQFCSQWSMVTDDTQLLDVHVDVEPFRSITIANPDQVLRHAASGQSI